MLSLPAQLTLREAKAALASLESEIARAPLGVISVDASPLAHIDSSALSVLMQCRRLAQQKSCDFEVHGAPARLRELAALYGVQDLLAFRAAA